MPVPNIPGLQLPSAENDFGVTERVPPRALGPDDFLAFKRAPQAYPGEQVAPEVPPIDQQTPQEIPAPSTLEEAVRQTYVDETRQREQNQKDMARQASVLSYAAASAIPPGRAAEIQKYTAALGQDLDPAFVDKHLEEYQRQAKAGAFDWESIVRNHPVFARAIADPTKASVVLDDAATLTGLEAVLTGHWERYTPDPIDYDSGAGYNEHMPGANPSKIGLRLVTPPIWAAISRDAWTNDFRLKAWNIQKFFGITPDLPDINPITGRRYDVLTPTEEAQARAEYEAYLKAHSTGGRNYIGYTGEGAVGYAKQKILEAYSAPYRMSPMIVGTVATLGVGAAVTVPSTATMIAFNTGWSLPDIYDRFSEMTAPSGEKISSTAARLATIVASPLEGWVLSRGLGPTFAGYAEKEIVDAGAKTLTEALAQDTLLQSFGRWGLRTAAHTVEGAVGFAFQAGVDAGVEQLARSWALGEEPNRDVIYAAMKQSFFQGLVDMPILASWGAGRDLLTDMGKARRAYETRLKFKIMSDAKEAATHPKMVNEFVRSTKAEPGAVTHAYVDMQTFQETAQGAGLDPREVAATVFGDGGRAYDEAVAQSKSDLAIPIDLAQEHLVGSKVFGEMLAAEGRLDPGDKSWATVSREYARWAKVAQESAAQPAEKMAPDERRVYDHAYKRFVEAQKYTKIENIPDKADAAARSVLAQMIGVKERVAALHPDVTVWDWYDRLHGRHPIGGTLEAGGKLTAEDPMVQMVGEQASLQVPNWLGASGVFRGGTGEQAIAIRENAHFATLVHELMHQFSKSVKFEAEQGTPGFKEIHDEMARAMGYASGEDRLAKMDTQKEERLAYGFNQYLVEGKSPSLALTSVFAKFLQWNVAWAKEHGYDKGTEYGARAWKRLFDQTESPLTPEMATMFDRMFATENELRKAQEFVQAGSAFPPAMENMTDAQKEAYKKVIYEVEGTARELLLNRIIEGTRREQTRFLKTELSRFKAQVELEIGDDPVYRALRFFRTGKGLEEPKNALLTAPDGKPYRFSVEDLKARFGDEVGQQTADMLKELGPYVVGHESEHTLPADMLAEYLGFSDQGAQNGLERFLTGLRTALPEKEHVEREAMARLRERYQTDLIDNPEKLQQAALDSVINEKMLDKVARDLIAMGRTLDSERMSRSKSIDKVAMRAVADRIVRSKSIKDIDPEMYARGMARATERARDAAKAGDAVKAWDHTEGALINGYLYQAARKIHDGLIHSFERMANDVTSTAWISALGHAGLPPQQAHYAILQALGLRRLRDGEQPIGSKAIDDFLGWAEREALAGDEVDAWDTGLVKSVIAGAKPWEDLTPDEAKNVFDAMKNIRHVADGVNEIRIGQERQRVDDACRAIRSELEARPFIGKAPRDLAAVSHLREPGLKGQALDAATMEIQTLIEMVGDKTKEFIWRPYIDREHYKFELQQLVTEKVKAAYDLMPDTVKAGAWEVLPGLERELPIPRDVNLSGPATRSYLWMVMLNMGNDGNMRRLLQGLNWTSDQVFRVAERYLSPEEMNFIQGIWDLSDQTLWPLIVEKERRRTGIPPDKVIATPFKLTFNGKEYEYRGGYFPARYSDKAGASVIDRAAERLSADGGPVRMKPGTVKTYTHGRVENYSDVVNLDWSVVPSHFSMVIHDLAFDEYVRNTNKIIFNKKWQMPDVMYQRLGEERAKMARGFLERVAWQQSDPVSIHMARVLGLLSSGRQSVVSAALGFNLPVAMADYLHPIAVAMFGRVGAAHMTASMAESVWNYRAMREFALANSQVLGARADHAGVEMRDQLHVAKYGGARTGVFGALDAVRRLGFVFLDHTDRLVSTQIWHGKFKEMMARGATEAEAFHAADDAVTGAMPTHVTAQMPALLADRKTVGALLMFQGYWSKLLQMSRLQADKAYLAWKEPGADPISALGTTVVGAARIMAGLTVASTLGDYVMGHGREADETWGQWFARRSLAAPFVMIPWASNVAEPLAASIVTGKVKHASMRQAPGLAFAQHLYDMIGRLASDRRTDEQKVWDVIESALFFGRLPARQVRRTGEYLTGLTERRVDPKNVFDVGGGLIYGQRRRQPSNPLTDFSNLYEGEP